MRRIETLRAAGAGVGVGVVGWGRRAHLAPLLASLALFTCSSGSITHLLPDGYTGPVVIVYGDPSGDVPDGEGSAAVYTIPESGVLHLRISAPAPGFYEIRYFYVREDGGRYEIPTRGEATTVHVFGRVVGAIPAAGETEAVGWEAYVVGRPADREDWTETLERAREEALGVGAP